MKNLTKNLLLTFFFFTLMLACKKEDPAPAKSTEKAISAFSFSSLNPIVTGSISVTSISATVPFGTNLSLAPTISVSAKATVSPSSGSTQDFSKSVAYTVTAEDGSTQTYNVTVSLGKSPEKDILTFAFNGLTPAVSCVIDATAKTISATLPVSTDVTKIVPTLTSSPKATVSPATGVAQDFTKSVTYTVTAEDGSTQAYVVTITVPAPTAKVKSIATHGLSTFLLKDDGSLWVAGNNYFGEFGIGKTAINFGTNGFVKIMSDVKDLAVGGDASHMAIIKNDNTAWAAGGNSDGRVGNGTNESNVTTFVKVMSDVKSIAVGTYHTLFLKNDNTIWGTGENSRGALGDGTKIDKNVPIKMMSDVKAIAGGSYFTLILKTDNSLWGTGDNNDGQLGFDMANTATLQTYIPVKIMDDVKSMSACYGTSYVIKNDNTLWVDGFNGTGLYGDGTTDAASGLFRKNSFKKVMDNVQSVSPAPFFNLILKTDNTLWATGRNEHGELGDGTVVNKLSPVKVMDGVKFSAAGLGSDRGSSFALKLDGTLWGTGGNTLGQLGDGLSDDRSTFKQIPLK